MTLYHPRPERWPQFSLRGFFVLVTLLCVSLGWLAVQVKWIRDRHSARKWAEESDKEYGILGDRDPPPKPFPWSLRLLGETPFDAIVVIDSERPDDEARGLRLRALFPEADVLIGTSVIDQKNNAMIFSPKELPAVQ